MFRLIYRICYLNYDFEVLSSVFYDFLGDLRLRDYKITCLDNNGSPVALCDIDTFKTIYVYVSFDDSELIQVGVVSLFEDV